MDFDPYQLCPCGSGKKLKFCCIGIAEKMEQAMRLAENHQPTPALQVVESLAQKHGHNSWVATTRAVLLSRMDRVPEAIEVLARFLEADPEHDLALSMHATISVMEHGYRASRKIVQRTIQKCVKRSPSLLMDVAFSMAESFRHNQQYLAVREALALAMRFAAEQDRREVVSRLMGFDEDQEIPFPVRGGHHLPTFAGDDELAKEARKAQKLASIGCYPAAIEIYQKLTQAHPDHAELWQALGLVLAWDGDDAAAAAALHTAAHLAAHFETGVECEVLAQFLDLAESQELRVIVGQRYGTSQVSRLLSLLDAHPRLQRMPVPVDSDPSLAVVAGAYSILDREQDRQGIHQAKSLEEFPRLLGRLSVLRRSFSDQREATVLLEFVHEPEFADVEQLVLTTAEGLIDRAGAKELSAAPVVEEQVPAFVHRLRTPAVVPPRGFAAATMRRLIQRDWEDRVLPEWKQHPQTILGGRSPVAAAADPAAAKAVAAAIVVLDAFGQARSAVVDVPALRAELGLPAPEQIPLAADTSLVGLTSLELERVVLSEIDDDQLEQLLKRAMVLHRPILLRRLLELVYERPTLHDRYPRSELCQQMVELAIEEQRKADALQWIDRGRQNLSPEQPAFQQQMEWDLRELMARITDLQDPDLGRTIERLRKVYGAKVPQITGYLDQFLRAHGLEPDAYSSVLVTPDGAAAGGTAGGLWTPEQPGNQPAQSETKLWLPQ